MRRRFFFSNSSDRPLTATEISHSLLGKSDAIQVVIKTFESNNVSSERDACNYSAVGVTDCEVIQQELLSD
jgi:hypothetical protein